MVITCSLHRSTATSPSSLFRFFSDFVVLLPALLHSASHFRSMDCTPLGCRCSRRFVIAAAYALPGPHLPIFAFFSDFVVLLPDLIRSSSYFRSMDHTPLGHCCSRCFVTAAMRALPGLLLPDFVIFGAFGLYAGQIFADFDSVHQRLFFGPCPFDPTDFGGDRHRFHPSAATILLLFNFYQPSGTLSVPVPGCILYYALAITCHQLLHLYSKPRASRLYARWGAPLF
jgi:hypothetical protein